jgi:hypothetical protein
MTQGETEQPIGTAGASAGRMLFAAFGGAIAWSVHLLGGYAVVAIGCVAEWGWTIGVLAVVTVALAGVGAWSTLVAGREWRRASDTQAWDEALSEPRGWYSWLMMTGMLLGITSTFTILLEGFGTLVLPVCGWNAR